MTNLFSYDNKFMQALMTMGDLIILNMLFLLCSIPIVTMGAAQAGLYTAVRTIVDKNDDRSPVKAFFRGFKSGFLKITLVWIVCLIVIAGCLLTFFMLPGGFEKVMSIIGFCIVAIFVMLIMMFHSRFDCTPMQLLRNSALMFLAHFFRVVPAAAFAWLTIFIMLYDPNSFIAMGPIFLTLLVSTTFLIAYTIMHKPFQSLVQMQEEKQQAAAEAVSEAEVEEITEEQ